MPLRPVASVFALAVTLAFAAGRSTAEENLPVEAPPPPPPVQSGEPLEPEVTIRETDKETVYEYRRNGQLVLVRVQPRVGQPRVVRELGRAALQGAQRDVRLFGAPGRDQLGHDPA